MKKANAPWNEPIHESRGLTWAMALYGALDILGSSKLKGLWYMEVDTTRACEAGASGRRAEKSFDQGRGRIQCDEGRCLVVVADRTM
jgi:hypothetical protein